MKQKKIILSIMLYACSFYGIIDAKIDTIENNTLTAAEQQQMAELGEFGENALIKAFAQLQKLNNKLTEIALIGKKVTHNPTIMATLTVNKETINALLKNQAIILALKDPIKYLEATFIISKFCDAFTSYLNTQIYNDFKDSKPFNLNSFFRNINKGTTRSNGRHLTPAALIKQLKENRSQLKELDTKVKNMGLTWYNRAARTLDEYVVTPINKWHLPTIALYGAGGTALGFYSLWNYGWLIENNPDLNPSLKNLITNLYDKFGRPVIRNAGGFPVLADAKAIKEAENRKNNAPDNTNNNPNDPAWLETRKQEASQDYSGGWKIPDGASNFAALDYMVKDFMLQSQPLGALAAGFMLKGLYEAWSKQDGIRDKIVKKRTAIWNFLRGGEYLKAPTAGINEIKPTVTFKDMVGLDEIKKAFYSIIQYIDNPEQLMRIEATPEKGWLLTGPTRTGKSFSVECLCGEIELLMKKRGTPNKMRFFNIPASMIVEHGIKNVIAEAQELAPVVLFIDEIDLLGLQPNTNSKALHEFLTAMQSSMNADPSKIVIIIAATNNPQNIYKALRQHGRFGKEVRFEYPARQYRIQYIIRELTNMALNIDDFDAEAIADKTHQKSFEDLKAIIRNAMTRSWMNGTALTQELLEESIDTEIHNLITLNRSELPENEMRILATHFAGIALAAMHMQTHEQLDKVTTYARMPIIHEENIWEQNNQKSKKTPPQKRIEHGAFITKQSHDTIDMKKEVIIKNEATILLSGFAAEELLLGSCGFTCHSEDRDRAYKMIEDLVFGGFKQETLAKNVREELKAKAFDILKQCHENAMTLLQQHKAALIAITEELMAKQILSDKEIKAIINTAENKTVEPATQAGNESVATTEIESASTTGAQMDQRVTIGNGAEKKW